MTLKIDAQSSGWQGVIYDNETQAIVWYCACSPHQTSAGAKLCARGKLNHLTKRAKRKEEK